jgi:hypothetical protein
MSNLCKHEKVMPLGLDGDKWCHSCGAAYLYWDLWENPRRFWRSPSNNVEHKDKQHDPTPPVDWRARLEGLENFVTRMETQWETRFKRFAKSFSDGDYRAIDPRVTELQQDFRTFLDGCAKMFGRMLMVEIKLENNRVAKSAETTKTDENVSCVDLSDIIIDSMSAQSYVRAMAAIFDTPFFNETKRHDFLQAKSDAIGKLQNIETALRNYRDNRASNE